VKRAKIATAMKPAAMSPSKQHQKLFFSGEIGNNVPNYPATA
jgi:hypothetical protein